MDNKIKITRKSKKAVSAIVATVLLVLITVAAVGIVWQAIIPLIRGSLESSQKCSDAQLFINTQKGFTCLQKEDGKLLLQVERNEKEFDLQGIQVILGQAGDTKTTNIQGVNPAVQIYGKESPQIDTTGLILLHHFNEQGTAKDSSGKGNDGDLFGGVTWFSGATAGDCKFGGCYKFDGDNDYIDLGGLTNAPTADFTLMAWIKSNTAGGNLAILGGDSNTIQWLIGYESKLHNLYNCRTISNSPTVGVWYHIAVTRAGNTIQPYTNGVADGSSCGAGSRHVFNDDRYIIGCYGDGSTYRCFNGIIDELIIFNRALSPTEIKATQNKEITILSESGGLPLPSPASRDKTYVIDTSVSGLNIVPEKVAIAPIIKVGNKETICPKTAEVEIKTC